MRHDTDHDDTDTGPGFSAAATQLVATVREAVDQVTTAWKGMVAAIGPIMPLLRRRAALLEARAAHRTDGYRDYRQDPYPPGGCALCQRAERDHVPPPVHAYETPPGWLVLLRMRDRRADRP